MSLPIHNMMPKLTTSRAPKPHQSRLVICTLFGSMTRSPQTGAPSSPVAGGGMLTRIKRVGAGRVVLPSQVPKIGRASRRERLCQSVAISVLAFTVHTQSHILTLYSENNHLFH